MDYDQISHHTGSPKLTFLSFLTILGGLTYGSLKEPCCFLPLCLGHTTSSFVCPSISWPSFLWHQPLSYLRNLCKVSPVKASSVRSPDLQGAMRLRTRQCNEMGVRTQVTFRGCWAAANTMSPSTRSQDRVCL